jgi:magnesium-transporting ATPase (P-type)
VCTIFPPLLPSVFTVSMGVSVERLSRKRIACIQAESILVAGKVTRVFFDKTGTLTEQGLQFVSVRSVHEWSKDSTEIPLSLSLGMAVCHTLTKSSTGEIIGNPVDRVMFEASGANLRSASGGAGMEITDRMGQTVSVVKFFDFDHTRMTQSVVVKDGSGTLMVFVKGSSESMRKICSGNTIPTDINSFLLSGAKAGMYQICLAAKELPPITDLKSLTRLDCESDLDFLGVVNLKNTIREASVEVVQQLQEGGIESAVITGDAVYSGVCIAREAGIIAKDKEVYIGNVDAMGDIVWTKDPDDLLKGVSQLDLEHPSAEIAISGECWHKLVESDIDHATYILPNIRVFGRCTPHDKASIVAFYNQWGDITAMVGDGGNDCGALKSAHVGVALSNSEASIVAPFTSLDKDIRSILDVLKEGRCALTSALSAYKYMIIYGQIETINQVINAYFRITFSEWCWVFMDGVWVISLAFSLSLSRAAKTLSRLRPTASLLGLHTLTSVLGVLVLNWIFTVCALSFLWHQDWFQCRQVSLSIYAACFIP